MQFLLMTIVINFKVFCGEAAAFNYWCRDANVSKQSESKPFSKANVWV